MYRVAVYQKHQAQEWDDFIEKSKNGTFILKRDYCDYHQDRFEDHSMMIYFKNKLIAVLLANLKDKNTLISHEGLTYGGLILDPKVKMVQVIHCMFYLLSFLEKRNIIEVILKIVPRFYHILPSDEIDYILFQLKATIYRRETTVLNIPSIERKYQKRRVRSIKKALKVDCHIKEEKDVSAFWEEILIPNLKEKFGASPVHTLEEIKGLKEKFPNNILQYNIYIGKEIVAGTTLFKTNNTYHTQYISSNEKGRKSGAIDLLFDFLLNKAKEENVNFDFGTSSHENGLDLHTSLLDWKEGFGGNIHSYESYRIETKNSTYLEKFVA